MKALQSPLASSVAPNPESEGTEKAGEAEVAPDKSWASVKKEEVSKTPPTGEAGVVEVEEEGKYSSSIRHPKETERRRSRRRKRKS